MKKLSGSGSAYLKAVSATLPYTWRRKKRYTAILSQGVFEATQEKPDITEAELISRFGSPEEIAEAVFDTDPAGAACGKIQRRAFAIVIACLAICSSLFIMRQMRLFFAEEENYSGYYTVETVYEDETREEFEQRVLSEDAIEVH